MGTSIGEQPELSNYETKGWLYGKYELTEKQKSQFESDFNAWKIKENKQKIAAAAIGELNQEKRGSQLQVEDIEAKQSQTKLTSVSASEQSAKASYQTTQNEQMTLFMLERTISKIEEQNQMIKEQAELLSFLKGVAATIVAGAIAYVAINRNKFQRNNQQMSYQGEPGNGQRQYHELDYQDPRVISADRRLYGGKTRHRNRKHKKRHTKSRR
jgi:hypothetical protein